MSDNNNDNKETPKRVSNIRKSIADMMDPVANTVVTGAFEYPLREAKQLEQAAAAAASIVDVDSFEDEYCAADKKKAAREADPRRANRRRRNRKVDHSPQPPPAMVDPAAAKLKADCEPDQAVDLMELVAERSHEPTSPRSVSTAAACASKAPSLMKDSSGGHLIMKDRSGTTLMKDRSGTGLVYMDKSGTSLMDKSGASMKSIGLDGSGMDNKSYYSMHSRLSMATLDEEEPIISAIRVDEDDLEENIREQIASSAAQAEVVDLTMETHEMMQTELHKMRRNYIGCGLLALIVVIIAVTVTVSATEKGSSAAQSLSSFNLQKAKGPAYWPTLASIRARGNLNCGISKRDEYTQLPASYTSMWQGFNADFCKAVAAATFDGDVNVTIYDVTEAERWEALNNGTIDILMVGTPPSGDSPFFALDHEVPATFSTPFLFDGVGVAGLPQVIDRCATAKGFQNYLECKNVRVCIVGGSTAWEVFEEILHPSQMVEVAGFKEAYHKFNDGCCNMLATDWSYERIKIKVTKTTNYTGPYALGKAYYTKQPYALATKKEVHRPVEPRKAEDDPLVWSKWVDWVLQSLIGAEQHNITQATANVINSTDIFGETYQDGFKHAVAAVGNYGEIYFRNFQYVPRVGMNFLADGTTGLQYHHSIGDVHDYGFASENGTLAAIKQRGKLVCGIPARQNMKFTLDNGETANQPPSRFLQDSNSTADDDDEDATLIQDSSLIDVDDDIGESSIDMELCRALASSLFQGLTITQADGDSCLVSSDTAASDATPSDERIEFVFLSDTAEGYSKLNNGELDVIAGYPFSMESDVKEPTTGKGYSYSQSYLFAPVPEGEPITANNRALVTRQDDHQWSDFVQIVIMALLCAEEIGLVQARANDMPYVNLFGSDYRRMMKDALFAVGNYGEIYEKHVEPWLPRAGGPNQLNMEADPQLYTYPGPIV